MAHKRTAFYTFCALALVCTFVPSQVKAQRGPVDFYDCSGKQDGNYVHPSDCTKFIACVAGTYAYEMDCSAGLNYDPVSDRCEWPSVVGCIIDPGTTTTSTTTAATTRPSTTNAPSSTITSTTTTRQPPSFNCSGLQDGNNKHPTDCSKFISCVNGEFAYEMDCPAGLHYDPSTDKCDYPEVAGCDQSYTPTTTNTPSITPSTTPSSSGAPTTTRQPPVYNCSGLRDGNYKHPTDCSKFISCVAGEYAYEMDCPAGLHYDPRTDKCDYPEVVGCESGSTTTPTTTTEGITTVQTETTTTNSTTAVPPTNGTTTTVPPTNGTTTAVPPTNGTSTAVTPPTNGTTTVDPDACDHDCQYVGIDCHNYYTCIDFSRKEYHECSYELGLAFNPLLLVCDRMESVPGCGGETTTDLSTTPENECGCEYSPHETDCSKYFFCSDTCRRSSCVVMACPGDLLWSMDFYGDGSAHQQCTLPERATCASKDSGAAHLEFSCYKKDDGLYRNENNCHSYWKCKGREALLYACPKGFIYNPEFKSCDFPGRSLRFCTNNEQE